MCTGFGALDFAHKYLSVYLKGGAYWKKNVTENSSFFLYWQEEAFIFFWSVVL